MAEKSTNVATAREKDQASQQGQQGQQNQPTQQNQQTNRQGSQGQSRQDRMARWQPSSLFMNPFALLGRLADEMAGVLDTAGRERDTQRAQPTNPAAAMAAWTPKVDVFQRNNELVVRADLPGVNLDDLVVEIGDDALTISGERQQEREEQQGGVYRLERTYGAFVRVIPLPEGAIADQAKASFKDGVLEITMPAPPEQVSRGRRLEVTQGNSTKDEPKQAQDQNPK